MPRLPLALESREALEGYQTAHYTTLAKGPANSSFIVGWLDHRIGNVPLSRCAETVAGVAT